MPCPYLTYPRQASEGNREKTTRLPGVARPVTFPNRLLLNNLYLFGQPSADIKSMGKRCPTMYAKPRFDWCAPRQAEAEHRIKMEVKIT